MNNNGDKPAYAHCMVDPSSGAYLIEPGMSKRERFAMAAMQGILANHSSIDRGISAVLKGTTDGLAGHVAGMAIEYADELLKQLES